MRLLCTYQNYVDKHIMGWWNIGYVIALGDQEQQFIHQCLVIRDQKTLAGSQMDYDIEVPWLLLWNLQVLFHLWFKLVTVHCPLGGTRNLNHQTSTLDILTKTMRGGPDFSLMLQWVFDADFEVLDRARQCGRLKNCYNGSIILNDWPGVKSANVLSVLVPTPVCFSVVRFHTTSPSLCCHPVGNWSLKLYHRAFFSMHGVYVLPLPPRVARALSSSMLHVQVTHYGWDCRSHNAQQHHVSGSRYSPCMEEK